MDCWKNLALAIVLQAMEDYFLLEVEEDLREIEEFFRSGWFSELCSLDPEMLIKLLKEEDQDYGIKQCERVFESGKLF